MKEKQKFKGIIFDFLGTLAYNDPGSPIGYQLYPEVLECLEIFKQEGFTLAALNNSSLHRIEAFRKLGIASYFKIILVSSLIGAAKPEKEAFKITLEKMELPPEDVVFVDDLVRNVEGARKSGVAAYQIVRGGSHTEQGPQGQIIGDLRDLVETLM